MRAAQLPGEEGTDQGGEAAADDIREQGAAHGVADEAADEETGDRRRCKHRKNRQRLRDADLNFTERNGSENVGQRDIDRGDHGGLRHEQRSLVFHMQFSP